MKKLQLLVAGMLVPLAFAGAQPTFSSSDVQNLFAIGKYWTMYHNANDTGATIGTMNIGRPSMAVAQAWNLPSIPFVDTLRQDMVDPSTTPFASYFTGATVAQYTDFGGGMSWEYHRFSADSMVNMGNVDSMPGIASQKNVRNRLELLFPAALGEMFATRDSQPGGGGWYDIRLGNTAIDAYGTLTCPGGSFQTLRVTDKRIQQHYNNLSQFQGADTSYNILWITKEGYLLQINESGSGQVDSGTVTVSQYNYQVVSGSAGVNAAGPAIPGDFRLDQNYPNPFNPSTLIRYELASSGAVRLAVYTILGQEVATLVNGVQRAGFHSVTFNGLNLPSGVYFYTLRANGSVETRRMILLK